MKKENTVQLLVFGEVLYDCFSPTHRVLGGAPFNVAWGLKGLGREPFFISAVGEDADGVAIRSRMEAWGMSTEGLQINKEHSTGEVFVMIEANEPTYEICKPRAWDFIEDAGFSGDTLLYHGLLSLRNERSHRTFEAINDRSNGKRFLDVNLRPPYCPMEVVKKWIHNADWLKLNLSELEGILGQVKIEFSKSEPFVDELRERFMVDNVLLTAGGDGALLRGSYGKAMCAPAPEPPSFVDTVGAGDAFAAVALDGILGGASATELVDRACQFAAKVCGLQGATSEHKSFYGN